GEFTSVETSYAARSSEGYGASSSRSDVASCDGSSHRPRSGSGRITGIRSWIVRRNGLASVVTMVQDFTSSPSGETHRSHSPANANGRLDCRWIHIGRFPAGVLAHS